MIIVKKNVYYCEFCKKKGLSASHMSRHEKSCTANPNRECRLCKNDIDLKTIIENLKSRFDLNTFTFDDDFSELNGHGINWIGDIITLDEILKLSGGCPNCTLAILRQTKLNYKIFGFNYDYQKELKEWWNEVDTEQYRLDINYYL